MLPNTGASSGELPLYRRGVHLVGGLWSHRWAGFESLSGSSAEVAVVLVTAIRLGGDGTYNWRRWKIVGNIEDAEEAAEGRWEVSASFDVLELSGQLRAGKGLKLESRGSVLDSRGETTSHGTTHAWKIRLDVLRTYHAREIFDEASASATVLMTQNLAPAPQLNTTTMSASGPSCGSSKISTTLPPIAGHSLLSSAIKCGLPLAIRDQPDACRIPALALPRSLVDDSESATPSGVGKGDAGSDDSLWYPSDRGLECTDSSGSMTPSAATHMSLTSSASSVSELGPDVAAATSVASLQESVFEFITLHPLLLRPEEATGAHPAESKTSGDVDETEPPQLVPATTPASKAGTAPIPILRRRSSERGPAPPVHSPPSYAFFWPTRSVVSSVGSQREKAAHCKHWGSRGATCNEQTLNVTPPPSPSLSGSLISTEIIEDHYQNVCIPQLPNLHPANGRWHVEDGDDASVLLHSSGLALVFPHGAVDIEDSIVCFLRSSMVLSHTSAGSFYLKGMPGNRPTQARNTPPFEFEKHRPVLANAFRNAMRKDGNKDANRAFAQGPKRCIGMFRARTYSHFQCEWEYDEPTVRHQMASESLPDSPTQLHPSDSDDDPLVAKSQRPRPWSWTDALGAASVPPSVVQLQSILPDTKGGLWLFADGYIFIGEDCATLVTQRSVKLLKRSIASRLVRHACDWHQARDAVATQRRRIWCHQLGVGMLHSAAGEPSDEHDDPFNFRKRSNDEIIEKLDNGSSKKDVRWGTLPDLSHRARVDGRRRCARKSSSTLACEE